MLVDLHSHTWPRSHDSVLNPDDLIERAKKAGLDEVRVQKSGCLDQCENGPTCVIYPEGIWYKITENSLEEILNQHLINGIPVEKYMI